MTDRQVILSNTEALVSEDLEVSFRAVRADQAPSGVVPRFDFSLLSQQLLYD